MTQVRKMLGSNYWPIIKFHVFSSIRYCVEECWVFHCHLLLHNKMSHYGNFLPTSFFHVLSLQPTVKIKKVEGV